MKKILLGLVLLLSSLAASHCLAATYYVCGDGTACNAGDGDGWSTGNNSNECTLKSAPCLSIRGGVGKMVSGDTLIVGDGTYVGQDNMLSTGWTYDIPSGTQGSYTMIKAENYMGAIVDGQETYRPMHFEAESYVTVENFYLRNPSLTDGGGGSNFRCDYCHHVKVLNMAAENGHGKFWFRRCSYMLVEGCIAWGKGTYYYIFGGDYGEYTTSQYNIVRRSVARRDCHRGSVGGNHYSAFVTYWGDNTYFQNNISLDANRADCGDLAVPIYTMSVFYTANGSSNYTGIGNISVNDEGQIGQFESNASPVTLTNNAVWLRHMDSNSGVYTYGPTVTVERNTFGNVGGIGEYNGECLRTNGNPIFSLKNNILSSCDKAGLVNVNSNNSYNILYNNTNYLYSTPGTGERTDINPFSSGLEYLPRTEAGSALATGCESSGRCGAEILKAVGQPGTLYGETGWDEETTTDLWPWPHEDKIKQLMRSYTGSYTDDGNQFIEVDGERGFCANTQALYGGPVTLTSYIWENLGNPCPEEICNYEPDLVGPFAPGGLGVQ